MAPIKKVIGEVVEEVNAHNAQEKWVMEFRAALTLLLRDIDKGMAAEDVAKDIQVEEFVERL